MSEWLSAKKGEYQTDKFKLILSRPAALDSQMLPENNGLLYWLINRCWSVLDTDGIILTQFPHSAKPDATEWVRYLITCNIQAKYQSPDPEMGAALPAIRLDRTVNSPELLPPAFV